MANNVVNSSHMQVLNWTNGTGSAVSAGDIVKVGTNVNAILCVALVDIADGASGSLGYNCSVTAAKVSAAVFNQGESLTWDVSAGSGAGAFDDNAATPATGDVSGAASRAEAAGANGETTCTVFLTGIPSTVT